jgi:flagellar biosynthetic protein FlhB
MEFIKSLLKISIVGVVAVTLMMPHFYSVEQYAGQPVSGLVTDIKSMALELMSAVIAVMTIVALVDLIFQRREFMKKMMMSRQELKDEYKQSEGDPMIKGRLRQLRMDKARRRMMQNVPKADVVITNPTHYAVALQYEPSDMNAPVVLAKGTDLIALRIREVAEENKISIIQNPPLARALFTSVEIDEEVPAEHYRAVAEIISYVFKLKKKSLG